VGLSQAKLYERVKALVEHWRAWRVVVDATGLGAGLASFLAQKYPSRVRPFLFTLQSKSQLGWDFIALVETGRYKEYSTLIPDPSPKVGRREAAGDGPMTSLRSVQVGGLQAMFWREVRACEGEVVPGPGQVLRWEVPDGRKDPESGERVHDDLLVSAALCGIERKSGHKKCPDRVD
jgi:hypothetical protein